MSKVIVITYKVRAEFTIAGDDKYHETIRVREIKRRIDQETLFSEIAFNLSPRYYGEIYDYFIFMHCKKGEPWRGEYECHHTKYTPKRSITTVSFQESKGKLTMKISWIEGGNEWILNIKGVVVKEQMIDKEETQPNT